MNEFDILDAIGNIDDELISGAKETNNIKHTKTGSRRKMIFGSAFAALILFVAIPLFTLIPRFINSQSPDTKEPLPPFTGITTDTNHTLAPPRTILPPPATSIPTYPGPVSLQPTLDYVPYPIYDWKNKPTDAELEKYTIEITVDDTVLSPPNKTVKTGLVIWITNILNNAPQILLRDEEINSAPNKLRLTVCHPDYFTLDLTAIPGYLIFNSTSEVFALHGDLYTELLLMLQCCDGPIVFSYTINAINNTPDGKFVDITVTAKNEGAAFIYKGSDGPLWKEAKLFDDRSHHTENPRVYEDSDAVNVFKNGDVSSCRFKFLVDSKWGVYNFSVEFNGHRVTFNDMLEIQPN